MFVIRNVANFLLAVAIAFQIGWVSSNFVVLLHISISFYIVRFHFLWKKYSILEPSPVWSKNKWKLMKEMKKNERCDIPHEILTILH